MATTGIAYVTARYDPIRGCTPVSAGCRRCWAARDAIRRAKPGEQCHGLVKSTSSGPKWTGEVRLIEKDLDAPLHWRKPQRIAVCFGGDLFHERVSNDTIAKVFGVMSAVPWHQFLVLTKRAERLVEWTRWIAEAADGPRARCWAEALDTIGLVNIPLRVAIHRELSSWPLSNVWLGVSVEDQATADARIPLLLQTPAAKRWVSYEPVLGPVNLAPWLDPCSYYCDHEQPYPHGHHPEGARIDWLVAGGESGPNARPCDLSWLRSVVAQCRLAELTCYVKQMGRWILGDHTGFRVDHWLLDDGRGFVPPIIGPHAHTRPAHAIGFSLWDRKGADPSEWPEDLKVQEMPG